MNMMNIYNMKLLPKYFDCIKNGNKRIELRLNAEKRNGLKIGDEIIFEEVKENPRYLKTKVVDLYYEDTFDILIDRFNIELFADKDTTKEELLSVLKDIYPIEKQKQYGIVGIKIELLED